MKRCLECLIYLLNHCQKSGTKWQPSMRNAVKMAVNSCKEMFEERNNFANVAVMSSWVFSARIEL